MAPERIVAEISRNWRRGDNDESDMLLSQRFELVIGVNADRGYKLESWQFQSSLLNGHGPGFEVLIETIVAVFRLREAESLEEPGCS